MHGLNQYDYSARYYDPATPRFTSVDPLAEKYYSISPYAYVYNNPLKYIDPTGMWHEEYNEDEDEDQKRKRRENKIETFLTGQKAGGDLLNGGLSQHIVTKAVTEGIKNSAIGYIGTALENVKEDPLKITSLYSHAGSIEADVTLGEKSLTGGKNLQMVRFNDGVSAGEMHAYTTFGIEGKTKSQKDQLGLNVSHTAMWYTGGLNNFDSDSPLGGANILSISSRFLNIRISIGDKDRLGGRVIGISMGSGIPSSDKKYLDLEEQKQKKYIERYEKTNEAYFFYSINDYNYWDVYSLWL